MSDPIYFIFTYLTDVPVNFWFWFLLFTAPVLVFSANPESSVKIRLLRLLLAIGLTYILVNLALHTDIKIEWAAYEKCQSQFYDGGIQRHDECGKQNIGQGASAAFYLVLGWIPAAAYVGIWEILWRIRYRKQIKELGKNYKGLWFSNIIRWFAIFCFVIFPITAIIGGLIAMTLHG